MGYKMKDKTNYLLKLVWSGFKEFADRFAFFILLYGRFGALFLALSFLAPSLLNRYLGLPHDISLVMTRVLLTITPIFPTMIYAKSKEEDCASEHYSMDLCFVAWIVTIILAWWIM